jgi:hypothetical protein
MYKSDYPHSLDLIASNNAPTSNPANKKKYQKGVWNPIARIKANHPVKHFTQLNGLTLPQCITSTHVKDRDNANNKTRYHGMTGNSMCTYFHPK